MDLAERLAQSGRRQRSILFICFTGEEEGLIGSEYFVEHPPIKLEQIVAMLNEQDQIQATTVFDRDSRSARDARAAAEAAPPPVCLPDDRLDVAAWSNGQPLPAQLPVLRRHLIGEFDTRPGAVRDRVAVYVGGWLSRLRTELVAAQERGDLDPDADPDQLVFEIQAALMMANSLWVLSEDAAALERARTAISSRIASTRRN